MLQIPPNYFVSMQLVPVFEWERVDAPGDAAPPAPASGSAPEDVAAPPPPSEPPSSDLRWVFKGYEWRPIAERTIFSRADWESVYCSEADARDEERDAHRSDATQRPTVPPPKPTHDPFEGLQVDHAADKPDPSES